MTERYADVIARARARGWAVTAAADGRRPPPAAHTDCSAEIASSCTRSLELLADDRGADDGPRSGRGRRRPRRRLARRARAPRGARCTPDRRPRRRRRLAGPPARRSRCPTPACALVESQRRKCAFLERAIATLGLANAEVVCARAEELAETATATSSPPARWRRCPCCASTPRRCSRRAAYSSPGRAPSTQPRTRRPRGGRDASASSARRCAPSQPYAGSEHRTLHVFRKIAPTPAGYPRRAGHGRKAPAPSGLIAAIAAPGGRDPPLPPLASMTTMGTVYAIANQKGGVGQDDDRRQRRRLHRRGRLRDAARRRRPAGQRHRRPRRSRSRPRASTTCSTARSPRRTRCGPPTSPRLSLLASTPDLAGRDRRAAARGRLRAAPARRARAVRDRYAYMLLDCPPSLGPLTVNALVAADRVIVPVQTEYFALEGLAGLLDTLALIQRELNPRLTVAGHAADDARRAARSSPRTSSARCASTSPASCSTR